MECHLASSLNSWVTMIELNIFPYFQNLQIFGWRTPLRYRRVNVFTDKSQLFYIDLNRKEVREVGDGFTVVLAELNPKRINGKWNEPFLGNLTCGDYIIQVGKIKFQSVEISVTDVNGESCLLLLEPYKGILLRRGNMQIESCTGKYYCNPDETNVIKIKCNQSELALAKVMGVLICSLTYDYILDSGSHI